MSAQVIEMHSRATWEAVREAYSKTQQMGYQSVLQAAKVGAMLIELKGQTHQRSGDPSFTARCKTELPDMGSTTRANLMNFAAHIALLEQNKPDSQRAALALIAEQNQKPQRAQEAPRPFKIGWRSVVEQRFGRKFAYGGNSVKVTKTLNPPSYFFNEADADAFALVFSKAFPEEPAKRPALSETAQQKLDRAIAIETARLQGLAAAETARLQGQFEKQLYEEVDRRIPEITAERKRAIQENTEETVRYAAIVKGTKKLITADEYRFLLQVLHPDRAPADRKEQFSRAFQIIMKLRVYAEA